VTRSTTIGTSLRLTATTNALKPVGIRLSVPIGTVAYWPARTVTT
jgi:hypothetical protein